MLIDAAHNPDGAEALAAYLRECHPEKPTLVISVMRDKDVDQILAELLPVTSAVIATRAPSSARAFLKVSSRGVSSICKRDCGHDVAVSHNRRSGGRSRRGARTVANVCVAGSIFLAGAVRDALHRRASVH